MVKNRAFNNCLRQLQMKCTSYSILSNTNSRIQKVIINKIEKKLSRKTFTLAEVALEFDLN